MTSRSSRIRSFVAAALLVAVIAAPAVARAIPAESLGWTPVYSGPADIPNPNPELAPTPVASALNAISFADSLHGWAVGVRINNASFGAGTNDSFFAYTSNGGSSWTSGTVGVAVELHGVTALSTTDVWAVGNAGTIVHWNGISWSTQAVPGWPATKAFRGVAFADALHGWVVGDGRGVVYTADGGATWSIITPPATPASPALRAVTVTGTDGALAVGDGGAIRYLTATADVSRSLGGANLWSVTFADAQHVWAVGDNATVVKSSNGGMTWSTATRQMPGGFTPTDLPMRSVAFAGPYSGVIVGAYQMAWRTFDAGATWVPEQISDTGTFRDYQLRGVAFAGSAAVPVTVARPLITGLESGLDNYLDKARAYRGAWTGLPPQPPFAPSAVTVADGGAPRPRATVSWTDNSADESGFAIERSQWSAAGPFTPLGTVGAGVTSFSDATIDWTSTWYYRVRSLRGDLSSPWAVSGPFAADAIAPTTTSDAKYAYVESATIAFAATDNVGGSGVAHTYSTVDAADQTDGFARTISGPPFGSRTLRFWSVDEAGNVEAAHVVVLYISDPSIVDTTPPVTTSDVKAYYANFAVVQLSAVDSGGVGIDATYYRLDGGAVVESSTVRVTGTGTHTLQFWSTDLYGHIEPVRTVSFTVVTPPSTGGTPSTPVTPASIRHGVSFTAYGYVNKHTAGTYPLTLQYYRYQSGQWVLRKSATGKVSTVLTFSKYWRTTSVPYTGRWRVRAAHKVGAKYLYSPYRYFTAS